MKEYTQKELLDIYEKLPQEVRDAIFSVDSATTIQNVARNYKLTVDKMGELADETGLVMLGITHPRDYISNLSSRLEVDKETAKKIAEEINTQIFSKIRESLKGIHNIQEPELPQTPFTAPVISKPPEIPKTEQAEVPLSPKVEIIKEIEKEEVKEEIKEFHRAPMQESNHTAGPQIPEGKQYPQGDPYRESIEQ